MGNLRLTPLKLNSWRRIALGTWHAPGDPSVYGVLEIDARRIAERQRRWRERGAKAPTITAIVARATALTLRRHPQINGLIRWGRIYNRETVDVFLQTAVDDEGKELSGLVLEKADTKPLADIVAEIGAKARAIREGNDAAFSQAKATFSRLPVFLTRFVLNAMSFLLYTLNLDMRWAGLPKDPFGGVMITSIGSLGLDEAYGPLVPYSKVPLLIAVGALRERAVVDEHGKVVAAPRFKLCVTFDHRFVDGVHGAKMARTVRGLLETDAGLDEVGL